jgi:hypothetical protein
MFVGILMYFSAFLCYWLHRKNNQLNIQSLYPSWQVQTKLVKHMCSIRSNVECKFLRGRCDSSNWFWLVNLAGITYHKNMVSQSFTAICCPPKASSDKQMSKRKDRRKRKRGRVEAESSTVLVDSTTLQYPLCWTTALFLPFVCQKW